MTPRIVDVCPFYAPGGGGVKTYVERKLRAWGAAGAEVVVLAPGERDGAARVSANASVRTVAAPPFPLDRRYRYFADERALHAALDDLAPDVVEASSPWASASMVGRWRGTAFRSLVMHADPLSAYAYRWFGGIASRRTIDRSFDWFWRHLRRLDERFDLVVAAGPSLSERLVAGGLRKVATIPMGVEPGVFTPRLRDARLRQELLALCRLPPEATLLVGAGRLAPEKRWPMVIDAVAKAGNRHPVGLLLLGDGRDRARVLRAADRNPHVRLVAPISDRKAFATVLASADALVHGCEAETFCMVAAEAQASGLPIIVPDDGGAADRLVAGGGGACYRSRGAEALASTVEAFLDRGLDDVRRRAAAAAPTVRDMDDHFAELLGVYAGTRAPRALAA